MPGLEKTRHDRARRDRSEQNRTGQYKNITGEGRTEEERTGQDNPRTRKQLGFDVLVLSLVKIFNLLIISTFF